MILKHTLKELIIAGDDNDDKNNVFDQKVTKTVEATLISVVPPDKQYS